MTDAPYTHLMSNSKTVRVTSTERNECFHLTGWYITVPFLRYFKKRIYVCSDCGHWERV